MEFTGERRWASVNGLLPEYGAIFMSNTHTKEECLRKKLFGLPSSFSEFVKKVKVGMVLFLFEYEERKLYGVFEAVSDGEIDIVPAAYGSSGKRFPSQVRVREIWNCGPLSEHEFSDAIKDNYFSTKKFHFGLSKYQVQSLLHLFSSRKSSRDPNLSTAREPKDEMTQSSANLSGENHPQHDLETVQACNCCCDCCDELGDFIPLSAPSDDEAVPVEGELLPLYDQIKYAPYSTAGDQYLSEPYIPVPIFCGGSSGKIGTNQESPVGSLKLTYPRIRDLCYDAKQANSVMDCQELGNTSKVEETPSDKCLYCDIPGERKSVFSRLNFASKATEEEENHARVDKFMDEIMGELQHKHDLGWKTAKDTSSAETVGKGIGLRRNSVFQRLGAGFSRTKSTGNGKKRSYSTIDKGYMEFMDMHSLDWENMPPSN